MEDFNKLVKTSSIEKFTPKKKKELQDLQKKIDKLHLEKRQNKQLFLENKGKFLRDLKEQRTELKAQKEQKILISVDGSNFAVSEKYLKGLKDPQKYIQGLYGRKLRNYQQKAYKEKDYKTALSLEKKLKGIKQKTGLSTGKLRVTKKEVNKIEKAFKEAGAKVPKEPEKKYLPIVTKGKTGKISVMNI